MIEVDDGQIKEVNEWEGIENGVGKERLEEKLTKRVKKLIDFTKRLGMLTNGLENEIVGLLRRMGASKEEEINHEH